ncbi:MAG: sugar transferase, partial [Planctomycetes bacterium]|nr:sugar transferase [Planctomycetota bacterium]
REFRMFKFRAMRTDAEAKTGGVWAERDDPRRTWIGAFLRRTSLDELPNLFNVLAGQMSLVGPRPERPEFIQQFKEEIPRYMLRHKMKAGMTGYAQVRGLRGNTSLRKRIQHDVHYIRNWSLMLDLRILVAGAEKLTPKVEAALHKHLGAPVLEGYGCTECSPVIAVNGPGRGHHKSGTVGRPLPGVRVRVVDPDFFRPLETGTPGMLLVRGPGVMEGYLDRDDLTAKVMRDGWYVTGDIGLMNEDGFIKITDRLSRFSKIGGEMVPHGGVEDALQEAAGAEEQVFAVTAVPDERKGERLAVLHTLDEEAIPAILETIASGGLPKLFIPRRDGFVKVEELPLLGTGKLDLREIKRIARERLVS